MDVLHVLAGRVDLDDADVAVRWDARGAVVTLLVRGEIWAAFDRTCGRGYADHCTSRARSEIPSWIRASFR